MTPIWLEIPNFFHYFFQLKTQLDASWKPGSSPWIARLARKKLNGVLWFRSIGVFQQYRPKADIPGRSEKLDYVNKRVFSNGWAYKESITNIDKAKPAERR